MQHRNNSYLRSCWRDYLLKMWTGSFWAKDNFVIQLLSVCTASSILVYSCPSCSHLAYNICCYLLLQNVMMYYNTLTDSFCESVEILTVDKTFLCSACSALEQLVWCWCALEGGTFGVRISFISVGGTACSRDCIGWSQDTVLTSLNSESGQQTI